MENNESIFYNALYIIRDDLGASKEVRNTIKALINHKKNVSMLSGLSSVFKIKNLTPHTFHCILLQKSRRNHINKENQVFIS